MRQTERRHGDAVILVSGYDAPLTEEELRVARSITEAIARDAAHPTLVREVAERQARAAERLVEDMRRYVLKHDGVRPGLATEEELGAARRAIGFLAGDRLVSMRNRGSLAEYR